MKKVLLATALVVCASSVQAGHPVPCWDLSKREYRRVLALVPGGQGNAAHAFLVGLLSTTLGAGAAQLAAPKSDRAAHIGALAVGATEQGLDLVQLLDSRNGNWVERVAGAAGRLAGIYLAPKTGKVVNDLRANAKRRNHDS